MKDTITIVAKVFQSQPAVYILRMNSSIMRDKMNKMSAAKISASRFIALHKLNY